ncbi:MAG TPA: poly(ADP-ribose) glycohydrolase domain-containing protein [bacterium]|nr:poly(ADP-ribose) glycohydrolase domain-containing protein [bacterium]
MGRALCTEAEAAERGFGDPASACRRRILRETLRAFEDADPPDRYHRLARENLRRWRAEAGTPAAQLQVEVHRGDWGDVTRLLTRTHGASFAVLNMANSLVPGGAYVEGAVAQEENIFRRTDCHFRIRPDEYDSVLDRYTPDVTRLLEARDGRVHLDTERSRVCIRGPEDRSRDDLGYPWLPDEEVFPFFELRASAQDLRDGSAFDPDEGRKRIVAQLDTLREHRVRHAVLGAFGCGAFRNPARQVARIYREEIAARRKDFSVVAFAIFAPGYGPDNHTPFAQAFASA